MIIGSRADSEALSNQRLPFLMQVRHCYRSRGDLVDAVTQRLIGRRASAHAGRPLQLYVASHFKRRSRRRRALQRKTLAASRSVFGDKPPGKLLHVDSLGALLHARGDLAGAEPLLREALQTRRAPRRLMY